MHDVDMVAFIPLFISGERSEGAGCGEGRDRIAFHVLAGGHVDQPELRRVRRLLSETLVVADI